jgi:transcription-repair coupling factor (superfamily II helicase)
LPLPVQTLLQLVKLRWLAQKLGFTKLKLKNGAMRCYFSPPAHAHPGGALDRVLIYVQQHPHRCRVQEVKAQLLLIIEHVADIEQAQTTLEVL